MRNFLEKGIEDQDLFARKIRGGGRAQTRISKLKKIQTGNKLLLRTKSSPQQGGPDIPLFGEPLKKEKRGLSLFFRGLGGGLGGRVLPFSSVLLPSAWFWVPLYLYERGEEASVEKRATIGKKRVFFSFRKRMSYNRGGGDHPFPKGKEGREVIRILVIIFRGKKEEGLLPTKRGSASLRREERRTELSFIGGGRGGSLIG